MSIRTRENDSLVRDLEDLIKCKMEVSRDRRIGAVLYDRTIGGGHPNYVLEKLKAVRERAIYYSDAITVVIENLEGGKYAPLEQEESEDE